MRLRIFAITMAIFLVLPVSSAIMPKEFRTVSSDQTALRVPSTAKAEQGPSQYSLPGDSVTGRVVREQFDSNGVPETLVLDASPCNETQLVAFSRPYDKEVIGEVECSGKKYPKAKAVQR